MYQYAGFKITVFVFSFFVMTDFLAGDARADLPIEFHGYLESNIVIRDTDGFQYGFMDKVEAVQQRNTLKFDVDAFPALKLGAFNVSKVHLTYRGAYDSIFDLRDDAYGNVRKTGPTGDDLGLEDIHFENDLREATVDIEYNGDYGNLLVRPGRQIVSWGETFGFNIIDQICPSDSSFQMAFANPDDLKLPLWMARTTYALPPMEFLNMNIDLVYIIDEQQGRNAPLDPSKDAPYAYPYSAFNGIDIREDSPNGNEFAAKVTMEIGYYTSASLVYLDHYQNEPYALVTENLQEPDRMTIRHPRMNVFGGFFSHYVPAIDTIFKGEIAYNDESPVSLSTPEFDGVNNEVRYYRMKPQINTMLGFSKKVWMRWLTTNSMVDLGFQWLHYHVDDYDSDLGVKEDTDDFTFSMNWTWNHGKIAPQIFIAHEAVGSGTWMTNLSVKHRLSPNWYYKVAQMSFFGDTDDSRNKFSGQIGTSEMSFTLGYQW